MIPSAASSPSATTSSSTGSPTPSGSSTWCLPISEEFRKELHWFVDVCRVVRGLKGARIGSIGERTTPFKTVRYSEKLLEASGISVESKSLVETVAEINALPDNGPAGGGQAEEAHRLPSQHAGRAGQGHEDHGEARRGAGELGRGVPHQLLRHPVLVRHAGRPEDLPLLHHEHDERRPVPLRLRGGRHGRRGHVRAAARRRRPLGALRLEQQLRRRSGQVRPLPLQQHGPLLHEGSQDRAERDGGQGQSPRLLLLHPARHPEAGARGLGARSPRTTRRAGSSAASGTGRSPTTTRRPSARPAC